MTAKEMDRGLPGEPGKRLVKQVRRALRCYGIMPKFEMWHLAWDWASRVKQSYLWGRPRWPSSTEIASQYVFIMLMEMRGDYALRLPHRAPDHVPSRLLSMMTSNNQPLPSLTFQRREVSG